VLAKQRLHVIPVHAKKVSLLQPRAKRQTRDLHRGLVVDSV
jgi:hypothetical protein